MSAYQLQGNEGVRTPPNDRPLRVLSLGAGVQSSALLLMACNGEIEIDHAIFGDTGWEPAEVYGWFNTVLYPYAATAGIGLHVVRSHWGTVKDRWWEMPLFITNAETGGKGMIRRKCTNKFKIQPVRRKIRELLGAGPHDRIAPGSVTQLFGISWDETQRMSDSDVKYITHEYPLVDRRMTREDCQKYLESLGLERAPRSSCIGCPYHSDAEWVDMKVRRPREFERAVEFDAEMRRKHAEGEFSGGLRGTPYLHNKRIPLGEVVFTGDDTPNGDCAGFCAT